AGDEGLNRLGVVGNAVSASHHEGLLAVQRAVRKAEARTEVLPVLVDQRLWQSGFLVGNDLAAVVVDGPHDRRQRSAALEVLIVIGADYIRALVEIEAELRVKAIVQRRTVFVT